MSDAGMGAEAIREVERLTQNGTANKAVLHDKHGKAYTTAPLTTLPSPEAVPPALEFASLQGIADFAKASKMEPYAEERGVFLLIEDPDTVSLRTGIFGEFSQRATLGNAVANGIAFSFGQWYTAEDFTMALLSQFAPTPDRERVFRLTGSVVSGSAITTEDDGVSQGVTVKKGIERTKEQIGPGTMFMLAPYSTFPEVAAPQRPFVLRMKVGNANAIPPQPHACMLIEADGGQWKVSACAAVKEWLAGELGDTVPVYG